MGSIKKKDRKNEALRRKYQDSTAMIKPREIIPIMAQSADPLGSYTGTPMGAIGEKPVQDADDL